MNVTIRKTTALGMTPSYQKLCQHYLSWLPPIANGTGVTHVPIWDTKVFVANIELYIVHKTEKASSDCILSDFSIKQSLSETSG